MTTMTTAAFTVTDRAEAGIGRLPGAIAGFFRIHVLVATALVIGWAGIAANRAEATLLFEASPVSDGTNSDNSIASGNTSRNLAVGADGTIYAVYRGNTGGIRVARSTDRGASFASSVQVVSVNAEAEIAVSTTGIVFVTWVESGRALVSRSLDGGQTFSSPVHAGASSSSSVHMATDANRVYLIDRSSQNLLVSADNGSTFSNSGPLTGGDVYSDIQVDPQTNQVVAILDNPTVKYFVSSDFGQTFGSQQTPGGSIYYSTSAISSGDQGRFFFISGSSTQALRVDLDTGSPTSLAFGNNTSSQGRSIAADRCGNVVDGYVGGSEVRFRVSHNLGTDFGHETVVATASAANVFINQTNGDILYLYDQNGEVHLNVYYGQLGNCYVPELSTSSLIFSALLVGQTSAPQVVEIINSGIASVQIESISISAEFSQSSDCIGSLDVGESCPISVTFTPAGTGTRTGELLIETNVFLEPRQVLLLGEGVENAPVAQLEPSSIDFETAGIGETKNANVTVTNIGTANLEIAGFSTSSPFGFDSSGCLATLIPGASCEFEVSFSPVSEGVFSANLSLDSNATGAPPSVAMSGVGVEASTFTIGGSVVGLDGSNLILQNNGSDDLNISSNGLFIFSTELLNGTSYAVSVVGQPTSPNQTCVVSNGSGIIDGSSITDVEVSCTTDSYTVLATAGPGGTISPSSQVAEWGHSLNFDIGLNEGYRVDSVGGCDGFLDGLIFSTAPITEECTISVSFVLKEHSVAYSAGANGSILGETSQSVLHGSDAATVTAVPDLGYHFVTWSDGLTSAERTDANINGDLSVTASFAINVYDVLYAAGDNGSIDGKEAQNVAHGSEASTVTAVPDHGYHFVSWSDGLATPERNDLGITGDLSVTASFAINRMVLVSGDSQTGTAGFDLGLPLVVSVEDGDGNPIEGSLVTWLAPEGGAVSASEITTGSDGLAQVIATLPSLAGTYSFQAVSLAGNGEALDGSPIGFEATGRHGEAHFVEITGPDSAIVGENAPLAVQLFDAFHNPILEEAAVCFLAAELEGGEPQLDAGSLTDSAAAPDGSLCGSTDDAGFAALSVTTTKAGPVEIHANLPSGLGEDSHLIDFAAGAPDHLRLTTLDPEVLACGEASIEAMLVDSFDNPIPAPIEEAIEVSFIASASSGSAQILEADLVSPSWADLSSVNGMLPSSGLVLLTVSLDAEAELELDWSSAALPADESASVSALVTFVMGPVDPSTSELGANGSQIFAYGGSAELTALPKDACGLLIGAGADVIFSASYGSLSAAEDNGDGSYSVGFGTGPGECPEEPAEVSVTVNGVLLDEVIEIEVICAQVDTGSPVVLESGQAPACAAMGEYALITVIPLDPDGGPLPPGQEVLITEDAPFIISGGVEARLDPESGVTEYDLLVGSNRCSEEEPYSVEIRVGGVRLDTSPAILFTCPPVAADGVTFQAEPSSVDADGSTPSMLSVSVLDACGNPAFGRQFSLVSFGVAGAELSASELVTADALGDASDGSVALEARSSTPGEMGLTATIDGMAFQSAEDLVTFLRLPDPPRIEEPADGDETTETRPTISGKAEPGSVIIIEIDGEEVARVEADEDGNWSWTPDEPLDEGRRVVTVRPEDGSTDSDSIEIEILPVPIPDYTISGGGCSCSASADGRSGSGLVTMLLLALAGALGLRRRRAPRSGSPAILTLVLAGALTSTSPAAAAGLDLQHFHPDPDQSTSAFGASGAEVAGRGEGAVFAMINVSRNPLVLLDEEGNRVTALVSSLATLHLMGSIGLLDFASLGVDMPLVLHQGGDSSPPLGAPTVQRSHGLGDLRLVPKARIYSSRMGPADTGFALAALLDLHLPTGKSDSLRGGDFRVGPRLAMDLVVDGGYRAGANLGFQYRGQRELQDLSMGSTMGWHLFAEAPVASGLRATAEIMGRLALGSERSGATATTELLAGAKYSLGPSEIVGGMGLGFGGGYGTPDWRAFFGVSLPLSPALVMSGVSSEQVAPSTPLAKREEQEESSIDTSAQSTIDDSEVLAAAPMPEEEPECRHDADCAAPNPTCEDDSLQVAAALCIEGECVTQARVEACPESHRCVMSDEGGACAPIPVEDRLDELRQEIRAELRFDFNSSRIEAGSVPMLDRVAEILLENPEIDRLLIEGHSDSIGDRAYNIRLSQQRAESVLQHLVDKGVDAERMRAVGYGPDQPVADNATEEGRAKNRRIEIRISEEAPIDQS